MSRVYTIGHSNRAIDEFIQVLRRWGIKAVVDVRRFPVSRKYPWFNREALMNVLASKGVEYFWLGELLGGYREGGYRRYMQTLEYRRGIDMLKGILGRVNGPVAIMCSEKLWFKCHRRFISDTLVREGFEVLHIINDRAVRHKAGYSPP